MTNQIHLSWEDIKDAAAHMVEDVNQFYDGDVKGLKVFGVPQGGTAPALLLCEAIDGVMVEDPKQANVIVDDLIDTGATMEGYSYLDLCEVALFRKPHSPADRYGNRRGIELDGWLVFPWERNEGAPVDNVTRLLEYIGEDPTREGLVDTPQRVVKALGEMTAGYGLDPSEILSTTFEADYDEMVVVSAIPFHSLCEHHMLPFSGHVTVAYIPEGRVVGLSKIPRVVQAFGRRLQIQEGMTSQIAEAINDNLAPLGVGVIVTAHHSCMSLRGVGSTGQMTTSTMLGAFRDNAEARNELLMLHKTGGC